MKYLLIATVGLFLAGCAHDQQEGNWDTIQREEESQKEEAARTGSTTEPIDIGTDGNPY